MFWSDRIQSRATNKGRSVTAPAPRSEDPILTCLICGARLQTRTCNCTTALLRMSCFSVCPKWHKRRFYKSLFVNMEAKTIEKSETWKKWCTQASRHRQIGSSFPVKAEFQYAMKCILLKSALYTLINCPTGLGGDKTWIPGQKQRQEQYVFLCFPACSTFSPCTCLWVSTRAKVISSHPHHLQGREKDRPFGLFCLQITCPSLLKLFFLWLDRRVPLKSNVIRTGWQLHC